MNIMYHKMNSVFKKCFDLRGTLGYEGGTVRKLSAESTIACSKRSSNIEEKVERQGVI